MEPGPLHLQLIMSVTLIVTAAVVAFICDVLKRNNEQLREMNIALQIRQEEEQKRWQTPKAEPKVEKIALPAPLVPVAKERSALGKDKKRNVNSEALAVMERGAARASAPGSKSQPAVKSAIRKDWGRLLDRNAQGIKADRAPAAPVAEKLLRNADTQAESPAPPTVDQQLPSILGQAVSPAIKFFGNVFETGFQDGHVLSKLIQSREPVSGLVVSIGVNAPSTTTGELPEAVVKLVESLIGPGDFATQSAADEFLLIYPQERGASAQRRLSQIARQLWDFQLRSLGSFQILFSWGGVEVRSESIEDAIASASERMQETKRGRKLLTMEMPGSPAVAQVDEQLRQAG